MSKLLGVCIILLLIGYAFGVGVALIGALLLGLPYRFQTLPIVAAMFDGFAWGLPLLTITALLVAFVLSAASDKWRRQRHHYSFSLN